MQLENGCRIEIWQDTDADSPRDWDPLDSKFYTWHRRYSSPDRHQISEPMYHLPADTIGIKVWMYDHSGVTYAAADHNPFHCPWDSGQVGWIFISRADARARLNVKRLTKKHEEKIIDQLKKEVEVYSEWASGEVYGYTVYDKEGNIIDSCGGFYGSDHDHMLEEAKACTTTTIS